MNLCQNVQITWGITNLSKTQRVKKLPISRVSFFDITLFLELRQHILWIWTWNVHFLKKICQIYTYISNVSYFPYFFNNFSTLKGKRTSVSITLEINRCRQLTFRNKINRCISSSFSFIALCYLKSWKKIISASSCTVDIICDH